MGGYGYYMWVAWIARGILGMLLLVSAAYDIKKNEISSVLIGVGFVSMLILLPWNPAIGVVSAMAGVGLGILIVGISFVTKNQIGRGDGMVFCVTGLGMGWENNLNLLLYGLMAASIYSGVGMLAGRIKRKQRIPFIPFIWIGYIGVLVL